MCLGEVGRVLDVTDVQARVEVGDRLRTVSLLTLDTPVAAGDWVLVHSGFALATLSADEAREAAELRTTAVPEELT